MRGRITAAALALAVGAPTTAVAVTYDDGVKDRYSHGYYGAAKRCEDKQAPGRNIRRHGLSNGRTARRADYVKSLGVLRRLCVPQLHRIASMANTSAATSAPASVSSSGGGGPGNGTAQCESGGNPRAVSPTGKYRGKWQFDQGTWDAFAPGGWKGKDPISAPESVQDQAAANVTYDAWPNC